MVNLLDLDNIVIAEIEKAFFDAKNLDKMIKGIAKRYDEYHGEFLIQKKALLKEK